MDIYHRFFLKVDGGKRKSFPEQSLEEYNSVLNDMLTPHFLVYKAFSKELSKKPGSTYSMNFRIQSINCLNII